MLDLCRYHALRIALLGEVPGQRQPLVACFKTLRIHSKQNGPDFRRLDLSIDPRDLLSDLLFLPPLLSL